MAPSIGDLSDRITLETFNGASWATPLVLWAMVVPVAPRPASALAKSLATVPAFAQAGSAYEITVRYRTDLSRAMRVRRGSDVLVITSIDPDQDRRWLTILCETFLSYAVRHDTALAAAVREGSPITFTKPTTSSNDRTTYDSGTDTAASPVATTSVSGYAIEDVGSRAYESGTLIESATRTLLFVPTTYGDLPEEGAVATWAGERVAAERVEPIAPDGVPIGARVAVSL